MPASVGIYSDMYLTVINITIVQPLFVNWRILFRSNIKLPDDDENPL